MKRELWSSQTGFVLASAGAAIGLGQIWKFPYMVGQNGGAAFIFFYMLALVLFAIPSFLGEVLIGALGKKDSIKSLEDLSTRFRVSQNWKYLGYLGLLTLFLVLAFYNVAASWALAFMSESVFGQGLTHGLFGEFLGSPMKMLAYFLVYTVISFIVVARGVKNGIEKVCSFLLPMLLSILLFMAVWSLSLEGFDDAFEFLFKPDLSHLSLKSLMEAAGHALFSLATGTGCALVYGAHAPKGIKLGQATIIITLTNISVALLAGLAIFPVIFSFGLSPAAGPTLMFEVLPHAFLKMSYGVSLANLFFFALLSAALTSSISLIEPLVETLMLKLRLSRLKACTIVFLASLLPSIFFILSFNVLKDAKIFGMGIFEFFSDYSSSVLLSLGAVGFALFATRVIPEKEFMKMFESPFERRFSFVMRSLLKFIVPFVLSVILVSQLLGA